MTELEGWNFREGSVIPCDDSMYTFFFLLVLCWAFTFISSRHVHVHMDLYFCFWLDGLKDF
jgi:hypothetical protein